VTESNLNDATTISSLLASITSTSLRHLYFSYQGSAGSEPWFPNAWRELDAVLVAFHTLRPKLEKSIFFVDCRDSDFDEIVFGLKPLLLQYHDKGFLEFRHGYDRAIFEY
jgi:hypothetical protein